MTTSITLGTGTPAGGTIQEKVSFPDDDKAQAALKDFARATGMQEVDEAAPKAILNWVAKQWIKQTRLVVHRWRSEQSRAAFDADIEEGIGLNE